MQPKALGDGWYCPGLQEEQVVAPVVAEYFPRSHPVQADAPAAEYLPAIHESEQAIARLDATLYFPASQLVQPLAPANE